MKVTIISIIAAEEESGLKGQHIAAYSKEESGVRRVYVQIYIPDDHSSFNLFHVDQEIDLVPYSSTSDSI